MTRVLLIVLCLAALVCTERRAHADTNTKATSFALIVTSNRSARLARPDLRYADDDGAKYYEMFRMLAPESNVRLLTTFDADTEKLFPDVVGKARPPTRAGVTAAAADLATRVAAAKAAGPVDFYFVFAGHGDIQGGKGFLDLPDGAFTADDLEAMLKTVAATRAHVILDSCNSFFLVNSRKPGGNRFVTSEEASKSLSTRLPNVGVFLSTSAEAEVFEWSELQSGVFSHAVRSGLAGAADVNRDGQVSYDELRAFVNIASKDVKNPLFRPQVFARGPDGRGGASLLDLRNAQGTRVTLDETRQRVTVRDANELPWFDLHKEAGESVELVLPARVASGANIDVHDGTRRLRHPLEAPAPAAVALATLPANLATLDSRGADDLFKSLFAQPFGALAFASATMEQTELPPLVLGVSADERERMRLLLGEAADGARRARLVGGSLHLALDLGVGAFGGLVLSQGLEREDSLTAVAGVGLMALGTAGSVLEIISLATPSLEEETHDEFVRRTARDPSSQRTYAVTERRMLWAASEDRRRRTGWTRWLNLGVCLTYGGLVGVAIATDDRDFGPRTIALFTGLSVLSGALFIDSLFPTTTERMADLWKNDPSRAQPLPSSRLTVRPTVGIGTFGVTGSW